METGQVTFHNNKKVKRVFVDKRLNEVVNRLNKTKVERFPDLQLERIQREKIDRKAARQDEFANVRRKNERAGDKLTQLAFYFRTRRYVVWRMKRERLNWKSMLFSIHLK
jgi:uncharacterized protein (UPF0305 family)